MGKPSLPIGSWGTISTRRMNTVDEPERWQARAKFRDKDGRTRSVARHGPTSKKAENALQRALVERSSASKLTANSRFRDVATVWLEHMNGEVADTTHDRYRLRLHTVILPRLGAVKLREVTAGHLTTLFRDLKNEGYTPESRRGMRTVLSGVLQMAVETDLIDNNPAYGIRIKGGAAKPAVAYDVETLRDFLARMDADEQAVRSDLPDLVRLLFGTGARFGEALALRWRDINLTDEQVRVDGQVLPPNSLWINGNLVHVTGKGVVRHEGKTFKANRMIGLPGFLHTLLTLRRPVDAHPYEQVFPSELDGWRAPSNLQRAVRALRTRICYPEFTTHIGRKTVATALDEAGQSARQVADQLGHSSVAMTQNRYFGRGMANPDAAAALDAIHHRPG